MKKFLSFFIVLIIFITPVFSENYKVSEDYLKNNKHPFSMNFMGEIAAKTAIKHALKKQAPGKYKVKFRGYTLYGLKQGVFKNLEVIGKNIKTKDIEIPYFRIKTLTDYNWIDYKQSPIVFKSDMKLEFELQLSEKSINEGLETEEYKNILRKINKRVYPLFTLNEVQVKIKNNKMHIIISYNFPMSPRENDKKFSVSSKLHIVNNEIIPYDVAFDKAYGNFPLKKVINLMNILNPLSFTMNLIDDKNCNIKIEETKILDDIVVINGKMYVKGDN